METATQNSCNTQTDNKIDNWFDEFIHQIRVDQLMLNTGTAPKQKADLYKAIIDNNINEIIFKGRQEMTRGLISLIIPTFIAELLERNCKPIKLAMQLSLSEILVWAVIKDDDEETEKNLYLAEAKINALFHKHGLNLSITILEESDNYPVPPQYSYLIN